MSKGRRGWWAWVAASLGLLGCGGTPPPGCGPGRQTCACLASEAGCPQQPACPASRQCGAACCEPGETCSHDACVVPTHACTFVPEPADFQTPATVWWWPYLDPQRSTERVIELPDFDEVMSTPVVVRLDGRQHPTEPPAVIFSTFVDGGTTDVEGVLRAVRGDTGAPLWTVTDPALRVNAVSSPAAGDLDGDGKPEIVTGGWDPTGGDAGGLIAFHSDGSFYWRAPGLYVGWGGPEIADLDGDGHPEVILGNTVLDGRTGRVLCSGGASGTGDNGEGPLSVVEDLGNGFPEILTGDMAYEMTRDRQGNARCEKLWPDDLRTQAGTRLWDGFPAVADLFDNPSIRTTVGKAEVAVVSNGRVRVQDWTGGVVMNPVPIPGGGSGGPPTIADFDGDGQAEIGVAGRGSYTVFKPGRPGNILWTVKTQDFSSSVTGSSVFDFDGNGRAEVVYGDECYVHVFDGATGFEDLAIANSSCTAYEMPVVAAVDGSGAANLLAVSNDICNITCPWGTHHANGMHGVRLFASPTDGWVESRPVWNEHSFHLTNVDDFGGIPTREKPNWGPGTTNSFRENHQGHGTFDAPDFVVTRVWADGTRCPEELTLDATVANEGARGVRAGLHVAFYDDEASGRSLLGVATVPRPLPPGGTADVSLDWSGPPTVHPVHVTVIADDPGTPGMTPPGEHHECDEQNNAADFGDVVCRDPG